MADANTVNLELYLKTKSWVNRFVQGKAQGQGAILYLTCHRQSVISATILVMIHQNKYQRWYLLEGINFDQYCPWYDPLQWASGQKRPRWSPNNLQLSLWVIHLIMDGTRLHASRVELYRIQKPPLELVNHVWWWSVPYPIKARLHWDNIIWVLTKSRFTSPGCGNCFIWVYLEKN